MKCHGPFSIHSVHLARPVSFLLVPDSPLRSWSSYIYTYIHNPGTQPQRRAVEAVHVMNHAVTLSGTSTNSTRAIKSSRMRKRGNNYGGDHIRKHDSGFKARREDPVWDT